MIKKSIFTIYFISSLFFIACGQDHQEDLTWLQAFKEAERNTVVLNNQLEIIPLKKLEQRKIASINLGFAHSITFDSLLNKYSKVDAFNGNIYLADDNFKGLVDELKFYNTVVLELSDVSVFNKEVLSFIKEMEQKKTLIIALFGDAKSLTQLNEIESPIIYCPQHTNQGASLVAQVIFGGVEINNRLTEDYTDKYLKNTGFSIAKTRFKFTVPEELGLNVNQVNFEFLPNASSMAVISGKSYDKDVLTELIIEKIQQKTC